MDVVPPSRPLPPDMPFAGPAYDAPCVAAAVAPGSAVDLVDASGGGRWTGGVLGLQAPSCVPRLLGKLRPEPLGCYRGPRPWGADTDARLTEAHPTDAAYYRWALHLGVGSLWFTRQCDRLEVSCLPAWLREGRTTAMALTQAAGRLTDLYLGPDAEAPKRWETIVADSTQVAHLEQALPAWGSAAMHGYAEHITVALLCPGAPTAPCLDRHALWALATVLDVPQARLVRGLYGRELRDLRRAVQRGELTHFTPPVSVPEIFDRVASGAMVAADAPLRARLHEMFTLPQAQAAVRMLAETSAAAITGRYATPSDAAPAPPDDWLQPTPPALLSRLEPLTWGAGPGGVDAEALAPLLALRHELTALAAACGEGGVGQRVVTLLSHRPRLYDIAVTIDAAAPRLAAWRALSFLPRAPGRVGGSTRATSKKPRPRRGGPGASEQQSAAGSQEESDAALGRTAGSGVRDDTAPGTDPSRGAIGPAAPDSPTMTGVPLLSEDQRDAAGVLAARINKVFAAGTFPSAIASFAYHHAKHGGGLAEAAYLDAAEASIAPVLAALRHQQPLPRFTQIDCDLHDGSLILRRAHPFARFSPAGKIFTFSLT